RAALSGDQNSLHRLPATSRKGKRWLATRTPPPAGYLKGLRVSRPTNPTSRTRFSGPQTASFMTGSLKSLTPHPRTKLSLLIQVIQQQQSQVVQGQKREP